MRVAINALSARSGAGVSMLESILPYLARIDEKNQYVVFYAPAQKGLSGAIPEQFQKIAIQYVPRNPYARMLWEQLIFPFYLWRQRIDILYSVGNITSIFAPCKIVLLVENANPYSLIDLPWPLKERTRLTLLRLLGWLSVRRAAQIRFVSQNSLDMIMPRLKVAREKCVVIPHGVSFDNLRLDNSIIRADQSSNHPIIQSSNHQSPYLLTIGANGPHRNTLRLLKAFSILVRKYGYDGSLVAVGNTGSRVWRETLNKLVQELGLRGQVVFIGEVPHNEISSYFKGAEALVFPSLEETFGIPLLEAMVAGVPIAASDCDLDPTHHGKCFNPFREICADAAQYFNPFDPEDMAQCVNRVLTDATLRKHLMARGVERVRNYKLEDTARALVKLFESVYNV